jgi:hypothetical protein
VKKILTLAIIAVFVMMPLASFAKTAITDSDLNAVTAQSGVTIDFSQFALGTISIGVQSWGDADGFTSYATAGFVGQSMSLSTNAVTLSGSMTIDVGTSGTRTALAIGLPGISVTGSIDQTVKLAADKTLTTNAGTLGTSYMSGIKFAPTGNIIIYAH